MVFTGRMNHITELLLKGRAQILAQRHCWAWLLQVVERQFDYMVQVPTWGEKCQF